MGSDHDGYPPTPITSGSPTVKFDGIPAARVGDPLTQHDKPKNPPHPRTIASGSSTVMIDGKPAAMSGSTISCGGVINCGGSVNIGDAPGGTAISTPVKPLANIASQASPQIAAVNTVSGSGTQANTVGTNTASLLSPYVTGNYPSSKGGSPYPMYKNTRTFPDEHVRQLLAANNHDVMLLTLTETFEYLQVEHNWKITKAKWVEATDSALGQVMINYGANGKDVVTTSMVIARLGQLGIKATVYTNHKGTELIKFSGWPNVRQILNAPVYRLNNPKVVDIGIGKYGLKNSIVEGARLTFYVAIAYHVVDFILNDQTTLAEFIGGLATDLVKIGIASAISWGAGALIAIVSPVVALNLVVVVGSGLLISWGLNQLDKKFGVTDKVVSYIEHAQQEVVEKAKEIKDGFWDLGSMYIDGLLQTGKEVIESEIKNYVRHAIQDITMIEI